MWLGRLVSHVAGLVAGAVAVAAALYCAFTLVSSPPLWALSVISAVLALVVVGLVPVELEGSPWRVPQSWDRLGPVGYPAAFGVALGTGLATRLSSPGMYLLLAWVAFAPTWTTVWPVFAAYAAGRALPFLAVAMMSARRHTYSAAQLAPLARAVRRLAVGEAFMLALIGTWALGGG